MKLYLSATAKFITLTKRVVLLRLPSFVLSAHFLLLRLPLGMQTWSVHTRGWAMQVLIWSHVVMVRIIFLCFCICFVSLSSVIFFFRMVICKDELSRSSSAKLH